MTEVKQTITAEDDEDHDDFLVDLMQTILFGDEEVIGEDAEMDIVGDENGHNGEDEDALMMVIERLQQSASVAYLIKYTFATLVATISTVTQ